MSDWTTQAADLVEQAVGKVRDKAVVPTKAVAKAIVYGLLAAFFGLAALALAAIGSFRLLVIAVDRVWIAHAIVGGIFVLVGMFMWTRRAR